MLAMVSTAMLPEAFKGPGRGVLKAAVEVVEDLEVSNVH